MGPTQASMYRVLVHRQYLATWESLVDLVGVQSAQQFWDHVAMSPGAPPRVNTASFLRGPKARPYREGCSRTVHYEISGAGRINYQFHDSWTTAQGGDSHPVVIILEIALGSH